MDRCGWSRSPQEPPTGSGTSRRGTRSGRPTGRFWSSSKARRCIVPRPTEAKRGSSLPYRPSAAGYDGHRMEPGSVSGVIRWRPPLIQSGRYPPTERTCIPYCPDGASRRVSVAAAGLRIVNGRLKVQIWALPEEKRAAGQPAQPVQITFGVGDSLAPAFSPDGRQLYIVGRQQRGELVCYHPQSGQFLPYLGGISAEHVSFSRDGKWVAYASYPDARLWRCSRDGSNRQPLTSPPMRAFMPQWSPDGTKIVFHGMLPGEPWRPYLIPAQGGPAQLAADMPYNVAVPTGC